MEQLEVFVYSGGKCGSSTLYNTLLNNEFKNLIQVHSNYHYSAIYQNIIEETGCKTVKELIESQKLQNIYIIDSFRDPIERLISSFFQNIATTIGENYMNIDNRLINYWIFKNYKFEDYHPLDEEYPVLKDFEFNGKYIKLVKDNLTFIKLRFKDIEHWSEYLSEIFSREIILHSDNLSENKEYNDKYKDFKNTFVISNEMYEFFTSHHLFLKYNSIEEQEEYKKYWSKRVRSDEYFESILNDFTFDIPSDFNLDVYRKHQIPGYSSDNQLKFHYQFYGKNQGLDYKFREVEVTNLNNLIFQYGYFEPGEECFIDVTNVLLHLISNNKIEINGNYNRIFSDPIYGKLKELQVYDCDNILIFKENESVILYN